MRRLMVILPLLLLSACEPQRVDAPDLPDVGAAERDSVIALLERAGTESLDRAFARLAHQPHTLRERLHQLDEAGRVNAFRRRTMVVEPPETETVFAEAEGTFDFGAFGRFVSFDDLDHLPQNPVPFLLADEPPFLTPVGREVYHFAFETDTTVGGARVRAVAVTAIPGEADDQPLRSAHLHIDPATDQVVAVRLHRHSSNILFGETSTLEISLAHQLDGTWLPERTDYRVAVRAALAATRRFHLERRYEMPRRDVTMARGLRQGSRGGANGPLPAPTE